MVGVTCDGLVLKRPGNKISILWWNSITPSFFFFVTADRQQMQALVCLAELEGLHIQQSASTFDKCNKEGLVRGLWRNHKHERKVLVEFRFFSRRVKCQILLWSKYNNPFPICLKTLNQSEACHTTIHIKKWVSIVCEWNHIFTWKDGHQDSLWERG